MVDTQRMRRLSALPRQLAGSLRVFGASRITWRTCVGLVCVPALIVGLLAWAFWTPNSGRGSVQAAIVNHDKPVKLQGHWLALGRELAGNLVASEKSRFDWTVTNASHARRGLDSGKYAAVVIIPKNFSEAATSVATATGNAGKSGDGTIKHATVDVKVSHSGNVVDPLVSDEVVKAALDTLNNQIVKTYLGNIYVGFNSLHEMVAKAAKNAGTLVDGSSKLLGHSDTLVDGTQRLADAVNKLDRAIGQLTSGIDKLLNGSKKLSDGLNKIAEQLTGLPEKIKKLAAGAQQVADGNRKLAELVAPLAEQIVKMIDALPSVNDASQRLDDLAAKCSEEGGSQQFCDLLATTADTFGSGTVDFQKWKHKARQVAVQAKEAVNKLAAGSEQVANGTAQLAEQLPKLLNGVNGAASGSEKLHSAIQKLAAGTEKLGQGFSRLAEKTPQLVNGIQQFTGGVRALNNGVEQFANALDKGTRKAPTYSQQERERLAQVAATPALASTVGDGDFGPLALALILAVALWALGLATYIVIRATPAEVLTSRDPTRRVALRAVLPGMGIASLVAVVLSVLLIPFLQLGGGAWFALLGIMVLAANSFVALNQALVVVAGQPGQLISLTVLVLTIASGMVGTVPGVFHQVGGLLPTAGLMQAVRAISTGTDGLAAGVLQLVMWLMVGGLATILLTERRRSLSARQLRSLQQV